MKPIFRTAWVGMVLLSGWGLVACDSKPAANMAAKATTEKYLTQKTLQGKVANDDGPVKNGIVKVLTEQGQVVSQVELAGSAQFSIDVPAGTQLPLILAYYPTADAKEEQRMLAAVVHAATSKYDINQLSTRIAKQAKSMGGYTHKNLVQAAEGSGTVPASNKTTAGFHGDPTTQYGGWH
jgi:hypothetical protein